MGYTSVFFFYPLVSAKLDIDIYFNIPTLSVQSYHLQWWLKYIFQVALLIWLNRIIYRKLSEVRVITNKMGIMNDGGIGKEMGRYVYYIYVIYIVYVHHTDFIV